MTATEELRQMLDERGVPWKDYGYENHTWWGEWHAENRPSVNGLFLKVEGVVTPAQAVEATLGRGTCHMETADGCQNWNSCSECDADYYTDQPINYCPNCGRKVVSE